MERLMAWAFAFGSACFLIGPFPGYADLVGGTLDAVTFFVGSLLFTAGGGVQTWLSAAGRHARPSGRVAWWAAITQSAGTLFFNASTARALHIAVSSPHYDRLVWRPDAFGSICFLVSGLLAYRASPRHGWLPAGGTTGWWQPAVNLLGCGFFGISAIAGFIVPGSGSMLDQAAVNWNTCAGAACFLACAVGTLHAAHRRQAPPPVGRLRHGTESGVEAG
jgi:hypothetical protein